MANKTVRLLTNAAAFPLLYSYVGRSTIDNQDLSPRLPASFSGDKSNADYGNPQIIYCENMLPFAKGMYSVGYVTQAAAIPTATTLCDQAIPLRDINEKLYTFVPAGGLNYVYNPATSTWASVSPFVFTNVLVTRAYVAGRTFICYEKTKIIEYNTGTGLFDTISLTFPAGVTIANVRGIGSASNYLLFFTEFAIYWCSPLNVLEFADINQGAGNQTPTDIKGQITAVLAVAGGFIVYTARNAIGATFTNNAAAPFSFKEITNAGGVSSWEVVTESADDNGQYVWSTGGLQFVTLVRAVTIFPEVTDFLTGKVFETWNSTTKTVDVATTGAVFSVKLSFMCGRYLCISYGSSSTSFDTVLVYDAALQRWGKLRITHSDVFSFPYVSGSGAYNYDQLPGNYDGLLVDYAGLGVLFLAVVPPKAGIAFLLNTGQIQVLYPDFAQTSAPGIVIFGRIKQRNDRTVTLLDIELDGLRNSPTPVVTLLAGINGKLRSSTELETITTTESEYKKYQPRITSENFDIAVEGTMVLHNAQILIMMNGYR